MPKENLSLIPDVKHEVGKSLLNKVRGFFDQEEGVSVSDAQVDAFNNIVESLPEGEFKEFMAKLENLQGKSAKINEFMFKSQDHVWRVIKPFVVMSAPLTSVVPDKPFSKLAIKGAKLSSKAGEKIIKAGVSGFNKIKEKFSKKGVK